MTVYYLNGSNQGGQTTTGPGQTVAMTLQIVGGAVNPPTQTFQAVATTTSGNVTATVQPQGSNDGVNWVNVGSGITIASGASPQIGSEVSNATFQYYRGNVTALTGTGASVTTTLAV